MVEMLYKLHPIVYSEVKETLMASKTSNPADSQEGVEQSTPTDPSLSPRLQDQLYQIMAQNHEEVMSTQDTPAANICLLETTYSKEEASASRVSSGTSNETMSSATDTQPRTPDESQYPPLDVDILTPKPAHVSSTPNVQVADHDVAVGEIA
jgi:hypothetical protein